MAIVTIIGAGMMGSALAFPTCENGHDVRLVGTPLDKEIIRTCLQKNQHPKFDKPFPEGVTFFQFEDVEMALLNANIVICGVSSFGVEWFGDVVLPMIPKNAVMLSVTKGLMDTPDGKLLTYLDLWKNKLKSINKELSLNAIGGPCTSYELVAHDQTEVAFCGDDLKTLQYLKNVMQTNYYHISITTDVTGIESAVALKNGYALGVALTIGLNQKQFADETLHFNSQAAVFGQAAKEMYKLLQFQNSLSLNNLCVGVGDLYVTVYGGRTRLVGILLGKGLDIDQAKAQLNGVTLESLVVAERVARAIKIHIKKGTLDKKDFPLLLHIDEILREKKSVNIPWEAFTFVG